MPTIIRIDPAPATGWKTPSLTIFASLFGFPPGEISGDGERNADGEPFRVETRSRIGTNLPKPILAKCLNGAR
jgi:hypothetical protein